VPFLVVSCSAPAQPLPPVAITTCALRPCLLPRSYTDGLADASRVAALAADLRLSGHPCLEQAWDDSPHVSHAVAHPEQYASCVAWLLKGALEEWRARAARRGAETPAPLPAPVLVPAPAAAADGGAPGGGGGAGGAWVLTRQPASGVAPRGCGGECECGAGGCRGAAAFADMPLAAQMAAPLLLGPPHAPPHARPAGCPGCGGEPAPPPRRVRPQQALRRQPTSTAERARVVMRQLGVSPGTINAVAAQISAQETASTSAYAYGSAGPPAALSAAGVLGAEWLAPPAASCGGGGDVLGAEWLGPPVPVADAGDARADDGWGGGHGGYGGFRGAAGMAGGLPGAGDEPPAAVDVVVYRFVRSRL
jgi:hypothetical protein